MPKLRQLKQYKKIIALTVCMCFSTMMIAPAALAVEAETAILEPVASGVKVLSNEKAIIDVSNAKDGYIMAAYKQPTDKKLKLRITGPDKVVYTYNLNQKGKYEVFPLSGGEGNYSIAVYENVSTITPEKLAEITCMSYSKFRKIFKEYTGFAPSQYIQEVRINMAKELLTNTSKSIKEIAFEL